MVIFKKIYIKKGTFRNFLKPKFDPTIHQKRIKLHYFKNFLCWACPQTQISKKKLPPPPKSWLRPCITSTIVHS